MKRDRKMETKCMRYRYKCMGYGKHEKWINKSMCKLYAESP